MALSILSMYYPVELYCLCVFEDVFRQENALEHNQCLSTHSRSTTYDTDRCHSLPQRIPPWSGPSRQPTALRQDYPRNAANEYRLWIRHNRYYNFQPYNSQPFLGQCTTS